MSSEAQLQPSVVQQQVAQQQPTPQPKKSFWDKMFRVIDILEVITRVGHAGLKGVKEGMTELREEKEMGQAPTPGANQVVNQFAPQQPQQ